MSFEPQSECATEVCVAVNHGERAGSGVPDMIILHYTGMDSAQGALDWLTIRESGVSCHYFVFEDGRIVQLVPEERRAHHAGVSFWQGDTDINSRSIGIEIANAGHVAGLPPFPSAQMQAVAELCRDCVARHNVKPEMVLAHSDVAPGRKQDPGENFDWKQLHEAGVGHWVEPAALTSGGFFQKGDRGQPVEALQSMLALYGYNVEINGEFDQQTEICVAAFQRHFRPGKVDGVADISTVTTLRNLLAALPQGGKNQVS